MRYAFLADTHAVLNRCPSENFNTHFKPGENNNGRSKVFPMTPPAPWASTL